MSPPLPDIDLWSAFINGDKEAFSVLFRKFYPLLYQYGTKIAHEPPIVEDAVQELFLDLWHKPPAQPVVSVKAYLLGAMKFKLYKKFREQKRVPVVSDEVPEAFCLYPDASSYEEEQRTAANLRAAVEQLPPRQKEVIYLRVYKGLTFEEVGEVMALNYQVVRNLLCTAVKSLKKAYVPCLVSAILMW